MRRAPAVKKLVASAVAATASSTRAAAASSTKATAAPGTRAAAAIAAVITSPASVEDWQARTCDAVHRHICCLQCQEGCIGEPVHLLVVVNGLQHSIMQ